MVLMASLISLFDARPVEIIIGFISFATSLIKFKSVISNEAILYIFGLNCFKNLRLLTSKAEQNISILTFLQNLIIF